MSNVIKFPCNTSHRVHSRKPRRSKNGTPSPAKARMAKRRGGYRSFDYQGFGHRLRVTRIALGITEAEAAAAAGRGVDVWRKYEATGKGNCTMPVLRFAEQYDVSFDWLLTGDGGGICPHLAKQAQGKVAILPTKGPSYRRGQAMREAERIKEKYAALSPEDQRAISDMVQRILDERTTPRR
jgi:hypothetical protein